MTGRLTGGDRSNGPVSQAASKAPGTSKSAALSKPITNVQCSRPEFAVSRGYQKSPSWSYQKSPADYWESGDAPIIEAGCLSSAHGC